MITSFGIVCPLLAVTASLSIYVRTLRSHNQMVDYVLRREQTESRAAASSKEKEGGIETEHERVRVKRAEEAEKWLDFVNECQVYVGASGRPPQAPLIISVMPQLLLFSVVALSIFLEDIAGDEVGSKRALWAPVVMIAAPTLLAAAARFALPQDFRSACMLRVQQWVLPSRTDRTEPGGRDSFPPPLTLGLGLGLAKPPLAQRVAADDTDDDVLNSNPMHTHSGLLSSPHVGPNPNPNLTLTLTVGHDTASSRKSVMEVEMMARTQGWPLARHSGAPNPNSNPNRTQGWPLARHSGGAAVQRPMSASHTGNHLSSRISGTLDGMALGGMSSSSLPPPALPFLPSSALGKD